MSQYVASSGYSGPTGNQSVVWHYKTDIDRNLLNKWFVNIFEQGILEYTATSPDVVTVRIPKGSSFIIKEKEVTTPGEESIAKVDMVYQHDIDISGFADDTYYLVGKWLNSPNDTHGVDFMLLNDAQFISEFSIGVNDYNYVRFGEVKVVGGAIDYNTTSGWSQASLFTGLVGWSGWSGTSGWSGYSGYSSFSGFSGYSSFSGYSGYSSFSGWSGWSSFSGTSGYSGVSGYSGSGGYDISLGVVGSPTASEVVLLFVTPRAYTIPTDATGSYAKSATVTTLTKEFNFYKALAASPTVFDPFFGYVFFTNAAAGTGQFSVTQTDFAVGDTLKITAPTDVDATLADISITIAATLL